MKLLFVFSQAWAFIALVVASSLASAAVVEHTFIVENISIQRLCNQQVITAVNGSLPGPTLNVEEGDTLIVHVFNKSPYDLTVHWHGIFQLFSAWADGPEYVTQCPIPSGSSYTQKFRITGQEGTLWWHAHSSFLRATVHGALIIRPRPQCSYPFAKPYQEFPVIIGEWWNANVVDVERQGTATGGGPVNSVAFTINGLPGDFYPCSQNQMYTLNVMPGKTYLLRIINAALIEQHFFKLANHRFTVVAIDASYTKPYDTDIIAIAPGQTVDALFTTNQPIGSYYMAASPYHTVAGDFDNSTTRALVVYNGATSASPAIMPTLPPFNDTTTAFKFHNSLKGLVGGPHWVNVPRNVDEHMFVTVGVNLDKCNLPSPQTCGGPNGFMLSASMNNESFVFPKGKGLSMLEAFFRNVGGVYTRDFPNNPPLVFNYTDLGVNNLNQSIAFAPKTTKVKSLKFNSVVEMVLQNTAILEVENHPMHIHGFNFHVLAQGFGNYNPTIDKAKFNFVDPQMRNTIALPVGGWAVIRFKANNPGVWLMHCHFDDHVTQGLAMTFEVQNGPSPYLTLPPPPADLPKC